MVLLKEKADFIIWSIFGNWAGFFLKKTGFFEPCPPIAWTRWTGLDRVHIQANSGRGPKHTTI